MVSRTAIQCEGQEKKTLPLRITNYFLFITITSKMSEDDETFKTQ